MLRCLKVLAAVFLVLACSQPSSPPNRQGAVSASSVLPVAVEDTGAHYDRKEWGDWTTDRSGCSTREQVLKEQGDDVVTGHACTVLSGTWTSPYDDQVITDPKLLQIDHVVPIHEAVESGQIVNGQRVGPRTWDRTARVAFYNDKENLLAVPARLNEQKGDQDPAQWLPATGVCGYLHTWVSIKEKYQLSADQAELDAIAAAKAGCKG